MHETQTSHYSQALRDGEITDREGSKHQLSTSNQLRNSNALQELEDSARRSATGPSSGGVPKPPASADGGTRERLSPRNDISATELDVRHSLPRNEAQLDPLELDEADQRMKDELDAEVDKKYQRQLASSQDLGPLGDAEDDYEDDDKNDEMKEDTIKTDKIEQLVEEDMKAKRLGSGQDPGQFRPSADGGSAADQILDELENQSIDELDVQAALDPASKPDGAEKGAPKLPEGKD